MEWVKRGEIAVIVMFMVVALFFALQPRIIGNSITGSAVYTNFVSGICVDAVVSDINPSSVGINEDFTVGILIDNCGETISDNVVFEITKVSPHITIKEPLVQEVGKMGYANSQRFILYHMRTMGDAKPGEYQIDYKLTYGNNLAQITKEENFSITIVGDNAELSIASIKTSPTLPVQGETVELTLRIENYGDGTANSIRVYADHPFQGIKEAYIGTLDPDEDGPVVFTFIADNHGQFEIPVTISYEDDFGREEVKKSIQVSVLEKKSNVMGIILAAIFVLIILGGVLYFIKVKRAKDKIIHQLLTRNGSDKKNKK